MQERSRNGDGIKERRQLAFEVPSDGGGYHENSPCSAMIARCRIQ